MRYRKKHDVSEAQEFLNDVEEIVDTGIKNAVFMAVKENGDIVMMPLVEGNSIQTIGLIESAKKVFMDDVLEIEED